MLCFLFPRDSLMPAVSGSMISEGYTLLIDKLTTIARTVSGGLGTAKPDRSLESDRVQNEFRSFITILRRGQPARDMRDVMLDIGGLTSLSLAQHLLRLPATNQE
jgi:hypothetical protein